MAGTAAPPPADGGVDRAAVPEVPLVLLVNDDGIGAIGLQKLRAAAGTLSAHVVTVAPAAERSGAGHSISLAAPLRVRQTAAEEFVVDGTPVDCVALALSELLDRPPDLVVSGVNRGPNLADDILYSGTCGAAREAAARGIPAVAVSLVALPGQVDQWAAVDRFLPGLLAWAGAHRRGFLNINIPGVPADHVAGTVFTRVGSYPGIRLRGRPGRDPRDLPYWWMQLDYPSGPFPPGTDIAAVDEGFISITPLQVALTDEQHLAQLHGDQQGSMV